MAAAPPPPSLQRIQTPKTFFSLLPISPLSLSATHNLCFVSPLYSVLPIKCFKSLRFSSQHVSQFDSEDEEETAVGDCLVFEEGIFDDPFIQNTGNFTNADTQLGKGKNTDLEPENLVPDNWVDIQRELNITKKERRKLSQQLEYGRTVEKRREALRPIDSDAYDKFKNEKLQQLKPVVLDNPEPKYFRDHVEREGDDRTSEEEITDSRVSPRNPRLAVYGKGLDDISELFNSEIYDPANSKKSEGTRKLFSKEEKLLLNKRVPNLAVATSGKWHPLHALAASGEFYLLNSLLKHNIDINAQDKDGLTAIHKAILGKKQAIFNFLLRESINPFIRDKVGATLLHYAVYAVSSHMIKILLLYNVDINLQDNDGWTPLHLAVQSRRTDIVRLLLIKGADKTLTNRDGLTPLDLCLYSGRDIRTYELIKLIKQRP
ncbi:ankyrin repeat domain-containing protein, chloroplastic [Henckelia pumila]|uniref:ankyrin repeat domain-containing protein, chloroplastic n=1 Tax=Henckelia pumila TaxID=405737 RepID=UPI003C6E299F